MDNLVNATIVSTCLGCGDWSNGQFTFLIRLKYAHLSMEFGGYSLSHRDFANKEIVGHAGGPESINKVLEVVDVGTWEDLVGAAVRIAKPDHCTAITRIWNKERDVYFDLQEFFEKFEENARKQKTMDAF